jgi:hypothetical protein
MEMEIMSVLMVMEWDGVTREQYDEVKRISNFEGDAPKGGEFHVAAFTDKGLRVCDVWASADAFQSFVEKRLMPAVKQAGVQGEPKVQIYPVHNTFTPAYRRL